jgi:hypothetical protein
MLALFFDLPYFRYRKIITGGNMPLLRVKSLCLSGLLLTILLSAFEVSAAKYSVAINGGRVMDPDSGFDGAMNVGIQNGRIVTLSPEALEADVIIDAEGLVVTAGFIDQHFHWTRALGYKLAVRDGVTTAMDLEAGSFGRLIDDYYEMHAGKSLVNFGTAVSHELGRAAVHDGFIALDAPAALATGGRMGKGWSHAVSTGAKLDELLAITDEGLSRGALGVASTLGYMPGATASEMFSMQAQAAKYGRATFVHTRNTPGTATTEPNGAQEILANAVALGAPASINHFNNPGWELTQDLLVRLREQGHNVWGEYYPYAAGSTTINAQFLDPRVWVDQLGKRYEDTIFDPSSGTFLDQEAFLRIRESHPQRLIVVYKMPESEVIKWVGLPGIIMASDAMPMPGPDFDTPPVDTPFEAIPNLHPRTAGARGKSLRLAREAGIPLMQVLASLNYLPAKYLGDTGLSAMQERGRLQEGMVADITIFNPATVRDNSTYDKGAEPTTGVEYVLVNGEVVLSQGVVDTLKAPGQPIRFPVIDN